MHAHRPRGRVQALAWRNNSGELIAAASCRCAAELARRHGAGKVPQEAVEAVTAQFSFWLRSACDATGEAPAADRDEDENEADRAAAMPR